MKPLSLAVVTVGLLAGKVSGQPAFFMGLGDLPGGGFESRATDVSHDGSVVVGWSAVGGTPPGQNVTDAFRWTKATGMVALGAIDAFNTVKVSADGNTIVGQKGPANPTDSQPFKWTADTGVVELAGKGGNAFAVNADGSVVVGQIPGWKGARWSSSNSYALEVLQADRAWEVSNNGSTILGSIGNQPRLLKESGVSIPLPQPNGGAWPDVNGMLNGLSSDGKVVVSRGTLDSEPEVERVFRWTAETGAIPLPATPDGAIPFYFFDGNISADGSVIVGGAKGGEYANPSGNSLFIWDSVHGSRNLHKLLVEHYGLGAAMAGWTIPRGLWFGVSDDGRTVYGDGINPQGQQEGWLAYLGEPVPEPSAFALTALAAFTAAMCGRGRFGSGI